MPNLLYVSSSVRPETSHSHALGQFFCKTLSATHPDLNIKQRDVGLNPPPHPDAAYAVANYMPPKQRTDDMRAALSVSDKLIDEIIAADSLVFFGADV